MTWVKQFTATASATLASLILVAFASGAGVEVRGEKVLFPVEENRAFSARLTPGGKQLLYHRSADGGPKRDQLVVRDLETGNERVIDAGPAGDAHTLFYYHPFDAHGRVIALPDYRASGAKFPGDLKRPVQVVELASGRIARTKIVADLRYAHLDPSGEMLIGPGPRITSLAGNQTRRLRVVVTRLGPVSPGPLATRMVLRSGVVSGLDGVVVHELTNGMTHPVIIERAEELVSTWDGKIVYVKRIGGTRQLCVADLVMSSDSRPRQP